MLTTLFQQTVREMLRNGGGLWYDPNQGSSPSLPEASQEAWESGKGRKTKTQG